MHLRSSFASILALGLMLSGPARGQDLTWNNDECVAGGDWTNTACWSPIGLGFPNGIDADASLTFQTPGSAIIPTSSLLAITVNRLLLGGDTGLVVSDNMSLRFSQSSGGAAPAASIDGVLTATSPLLGSSGIRVAPPTTPGTEINMVIDGSGEIRLGANGGLITESSTSLEIRGGIEITTSGTTDQPASINADLTNRGGEIRVLQGRLIVQGTIVNGGGGFVEVFDQFETGNSVLELRGEIRGGRVYPGDGVIRLNGGELRSVEVQPGAVDVELNGRFGGAVELDPNTVVTIPAGTILDIANGSGAGQPAVRNDGAIRVGSASGGGVLRNAGSITALEGSGTVWLDHPGSQITTSTGSGIFENGANHTIRGAASIQCQIFNLGQIIAEGGRMTFLEPLTGTQGDLFIGGDAAAPGIVDVRSPIFTNDLTLGPWGRLEVGPGQGISLSGNYTIATTVETASSWPGGTAIVFRGEGAPQGFEAASTDQGATNGGFSLNFGIPRFAVFGAGTHVYLRDTIDNGNRVNGPEAIYVTELEVFPGTVLDLNGICLYTKVQGAPVRVMAGDGSLFGGGTIVDDGSVTTNVDDRPAGAGLEFVRVAPNPFNPRTTVNFRLESPDEIYVEVFDLKGRRLRTLERGSFAAGTHAVEWDGRDAQGRAMASGVYAVRIATGASTWTQRVTLLK